MKSPLSTLTSVFLALVADVGIASAQPSGQVYRIGYLWIGTPGLPQVPMEKWTGPGATFRETLQRDGLVLGKNLFVDVRHAQGDVARLAGEAESLVASNVDLIVTSGTAPTAAAAHATKHIPIVFNGVGDPVGKGFVASLARPGGNMTGMAATVVGKKLWQLLRDIAPATRRAGALLYAPNLFAYSPADQSRHSAALLAFGAASGLEPIELSISTLDEIASRFAELGNGGDAGIVIITDNTLFSWRSSIIEMALRYRLPTVCTQWAGWGEAGCLVTYAEDFHALNRGAATKVAKILKGAKPADIPVEQPMAFSLIINVKTAQALGLIVPPSLLAAADQVIE